MKGKLLVAGLVVFATLGIGLGAMRVQRHSLTGYNLEYQQAMAKIGERWLPAHVATSWPEHGRNDTMVARVHWAENPKELARSLGTEFVGARDKAGYPAWEAADCYVELVDEKDHSLGVFHMERQGMVVTASPLPDGITPW